MSLNPLRVRSSGLSTLSSFFILIHGERGYITMLLIYGSLFLTFMTELPDNVLNAVFFNFLFFIIDLVALFTLFLHIYFSFDNTNILTCRHSFITFAVAQLHIFTAAVWRNLHGEPSQDLNSGLSYRQQASTLPSELRCTPILNPWRKRLHCTRNTISLWQGYLRVILMTKG
jgi:hypothetical protein